MNNAFLELGIIFEESAAGVTLTPAMDLFQFPEGTPLRITLSSDADGVTLTRHFTGYSVGELHATSSLHEVMASVLVELTELCDLDRYRHAA